jgi:hypothetical protein
MADQTALKPAPAPSPGVPSVQPPAGNSGRHWKRFTATMSGVIVCAALAMFWSSGRYTGAAIGIIGGMVIAFVGGDSASKFAGPRPPFQPPRF